MIKKIIILKPQKLEANCSKRSSESRSTACATKKVFSKVNHPDRDSNVQQRNVNSCRVCLKNGHIPIYSEDIGSDLSIDVSVFGGILLSRYDTHPKYLCEPCHTLLHGAVVFRKTAQQSDKFLRNLTKCDLTNESTADHDSNVSDDVKDSTNIIDLDCEMKPEIYVKEIAQTTFRCNPCNLNFNTNKQFLSHITTKEHNKLDPDPLIQNSTEDVTNDSNIECTNQDSNVSDKDQDEITDIESDSEKPDKSKEINKIKVICCDPCNLDFQTNKEYLTHKNTKEHKRLSNRNIFCWVCKKLCHVSYYMSHHKSHEQEVAKQPANKNTNHIQKEKLQEDPKKNLHCDRCDLDFKSVEDLQTHKRTDDHVKRKVTCTICNVAYNRSYIEDHYAIHKNDPLHICDICGKSFTLRMRLMRHRKTHSHDLPFKCSLCPYRGRFNENLKLHMRTHTGEKRYGCPHCPTRFFKFKSNLNRHLVIHSGVRNFKCEQCQHKFYTNRDLKEHFNLVHITTGKDNICKICGNRYKTRYGLKGHELKVHKREKSKGGRMPLYLIAEKLKNTDQSVNSSYTAL